MQLTLDTNDLQPTIEQIVRVVLAETEPLRDKLNGRLALTEEEAAEMLGVRRNVLRDARLVRGEIKASQVGKQIVYSVDSLRQFLVDQEIER